MVAPLEAPLFTAWVSDLARRHSAALAGVARSEGLLGGDAVDAVQEALSTFLLLPQARTLVGHAADSHAFLTVIVRNAARNLRRRQQRGRPDKSFTSRGTAFADTGPSADELIAAAEEHVRLLGCVQRLTDIQRHVVTLRMLEELSSTEVATSLSLAPGHVAVLLHRAKKALRDCMVDTLSAP